MNGSNLILGSWLPDMDLNHDKQIQSLLCYRYTIRQSPYHPSGSPGRVKFRAAN